MKRVIAFANILVVFISVNAVAQESARTVQYHSQDIVPIRAKLKFTSERYLNRILFGAARGCMLEA